MLAEDDDTLYVAFMGTKQRRDLVANAAVLQVPLWPDPDGTNVCPLLPIAWSHYQVRATSPPQVMNQQWSKLLLACRVPCVCYVRGATVFFPIAMAF